MATYVPLSRPARLALTFVVVDQLDAVLRTQVETWLTRALVDVTLAARANETCRRHQNKRHTQFISCASYMYIAQILSKITAEIDA